ncbi:MAG: OsmC family protein [Euryarchaeota archaeon]|nr:OsmC family protein [Euryarchaeota archaeon]
MSDVETVEAIWHGPKKVALSAREHEMIADKPVAKGGTEKGPMPSEIFLASLAACESMSFMRVAEARRVPISGLKVTASAHFDEKGFIDSIELVYATKTTAQERDVAKVLELAERFCTVKALVKHLPVKSTIAIVP